MHPRKASEKPIFKNLVIALAGPLDGQWTDVNIARWVSQRAGRFAAQMDASVTHLVCSGEAFKARGPRGMLPFPSPSRTPRLKIAFLDTVKEALARPRSCWIVTKDWLEDSITGKRRLDEEGFAVDKAEKEARKKKKRRERQERGDALAERAVNPCESLVWFPVGGGRRADVWTDYWHTYRDGTFFRYEVVISRMEGEVERRFELSVSFSFFCSCTSFSISQHHHTQA
jgi:hypothetical protein